MAFPSLIDYKRYTEENKSGSRPASNRSDSLSEQPVLYHDTAGYVKKHIQNASAMMSQIQDDMPLSKISASILNSVSIELLKSERSILASFQGQEKPVPYKKDAGICAIPDDFCSVSAPKHALLAVRYNSFLPPFHYEWYSRKAKEKDASQDQKTAADSFGLEESCKSCESLPILCCGVTISPRSFSGSKSSWSNSSST